MVVFHLQAREQIRRPSVVLSRRDGLGPVGRVDSWQVYLVEVAYHLRRVVAADPDALGVLTAPPGAAWWLRPPVGDLVLVEDFLASMQRYGFSDEDAAAIYLAFFTRLLALFCVQARGSLPVPGDSALEEDAYPTLNRLRPLLSHDRDRDDFEDALDDVLTGLERDLKR